MLMRLDIATTMNLATYSLPLSEWSFAKSAITDSYVIYNSQWCRLRLFIENDRAGKALHVYYGRLHAPDDALLMKWKGKSCYCWHGYYDLTRMLEYLDGISPQDAYQRRLELIPFARNYDNSDFAKSISSNEERHLRFHAAIWKHYGLRFFELLDLHRTDLWKSYIEFLKEYYRLFDEESRAIYQQRDLIWRPFDPPQWRKC